MRLEGESGAVSQSLRSYLNRSFADDTSRPLKRIMWAERRVVDDLGTALEVYGGLAITPNLKRLAAKGTQTFDSWLDTYTSVDCMNSSIKQPMSEQ